MSFSAASPPWSRDLALVVVTAVSRRALFCAPPYSRSRGLVRYAFPSSAAVDLRALSSSVRVSEWRKMGGSQFSVSLLTYQRVLPSGAHTLYSRDRKGCSSPTVRRVVVQASLVQRCPVLRPLDHVVAARPVSEAPRSCLPCAGIRSTCRGLRGR